VGLLRGDAVASDDVGGVETSVDQLLRLRKQLAYPPQPPPARCNKSETRGKNCYFRAMKERVDKIGASIPPKHTTKLLPSPISCSCMAAAMESKRAAA
jgi:hypothetical protein